MIARLQEVYNKNLSLLSKQIGLSNVMAIPRLKKITLSMGCGKFSKDSKMLDRVQNELSKIAGQKAVPAKAKKSIAAFSVREGMTVGSYVHLRRERMYNFIDRLVYTALTNIQDFQGLSLKCLDGKGGCNLGIRDSSVFLEIDEGVCGLNISIDTTANSDKEVLPLLQLLGIPFKGVNRG